MIVKGRGLGGEEERIDQKRGGNEEDRTEDRLGEQEEYMYNNI